MRCSCFFDYNIKKTIKKKLKVASAYKAEKAIYYMILCCIVLYYNLFTEHLECI